MDVTRRSDAAARRLRRRSPTKHRNLNLAGKNRRRPTYGAATRLARIVHSVLTQPSGRSFTGLQAELGISQRTLLRYISACRRRLVETSGRPLLEVARYGERAVLRRASFANAPESTVFQVLYF